MTTFPTVRAEGGLLTADLLERVANLDDDLGNLSPEAFGLPEGTRLNAAIERSWSAANRYWRGFHVKVERGTADVTATRELWLFPLLEELGWERPSYRPAAETVGDRRYPVSHRAADADGLGSPPLHLVGWGEALEQAKGGAGRGLSPHGLMQEYLNRTDHLWGIVSNGRRLRLLRDNQSLSRAAFVEADLEGMLGGGAYADFRLLWLLAHRSRFPGPAVDPDHCPLERWRVADEDRGARALNDLRGGVEQAIEALGQGFLDHPANWADPDRPDTLGSRLAAGRLTPAAYYRQLLRLVYRLLFLFAAEERNLLFPEGTDPAVRAPYDRCYSASRLRDLVARRRSRDRHDDLWRGLRLTFAALAGEEEAAPPSPLGLQPLGGLFEASSCPDLDRAALGNAPLIDAVRALSVVAGRDGTRRRVNYRDMDVEELGSVYESLLELQPAISGDAGRRRFDFARSGERKSTGSYYTNSGLVHELVRSALDPVIEAAVERGKNPAEQCANLLALTVCDPACGSGHFLLAAARRIGRRVAEIEAAGGEPTPGAERRAVRAAIGCVHGVDLNELAVDLCKVALWLEGHDPGKPMGFLDARIRHGNALVGATEAAMADGIPDAAFDPVAGDDRGYARDVKRRNRGERKGQTSFEGQGTAGWVVSRLSTPGAVERYFATMHAPDDDLAAVREKRRAHHRATHTPEAVRDELVADLWTAAFFWPLREGEAPPPTEGTWRRLAGSERLTDFVDGRTAAALAESADGRTVRQARALRRRHRFFHWPLAFPEVFDRADPGFDCVLANPPWERVKLQEQEFFAQRDPEIAAAPNAAARKRLIAALPSSADPAQRALHRAYEEALADAENTSGFLRGSGRYPLTGRGDVNLYSVFAETLVGVISPRGQAGVIVPTGIATDDTNKHFFGWLVDDGRLRALYDFENQNQKKIFEGVDSRMKFSLLTVAGSGRPDRAFEAAFFLRDPAKVREAGRAFTLTADDIALLNPNTRTSPVFRSRRDAEITTAIYRAVPVLVREGPPEANPWGVTFKRMFDMSNDSHLFRTHAELADAGLTLQADGRFHGAGGEVWLPLYEAKMIHQYDHRFATYNPAGDDTRDLTDREHADPWCLPLPRYWVEEQEVERAAGGKRGWFLGFRDIARNTDKRTAIFSIAPWAGIGNSQPITELVLEEARSVAGLQSNLSSMSFDFVTRQKAGGTHLNFFIVKQLPVLPPETYTPSLLALIVPRVLELTYTAWDLQPFARDLGHDGPPFGWDPERRARLRADLDGVFAHLYGLSRDDFDYVLGTFDIVNSNDQKEFGEERTRRLCLEAWDRFAEDALLTLRREIDAVELKLRRLVARTLGPGLDRVPETTRARMLEVLAQRRAAAGQRDAAATADRATLAEALEAATILGLAKTMTAPANRAAFAAAFPDHHELDARFTRLNALRNVLNHGERWPADTVREEGEAAIAWFRARVGG